MGFFSFLKNISTRTRDLRGLTDDHSVRELQKTAILISFTLLKEINQYRDWRKPLTASQCAVSRAAARAPEMQSSD